MKMEIQRIYCKLCGFERVIDADDKKKADKSIEEVRTHVRTAHRERCLVSSRWEDDFVNSETIVCGDTWAEKMKLPSK
jgi:hypothetical protein